MANTAEMVAHRHDQDGYEVPYTLRDHLDEQDRQFAATWWVDADEEAPWVTGR
jgi:hypothetical protein